MEWVSESFREGTRLDEERKVDVLTNFFLRTSLLMISKALLQNDAAACCYCLLTCFWLYGHPRM